jgi:hypothetical protein
MRACFLGQNVCARGFGMATLQTGPLELDEETGQPSPVPQGQTLSDCTKLSPPQVGSCRF